MANKYNKKNSGKKTMEDYRNSQRRMGVAARVIAVVMAVVMIGFTVVMALQGVAY